MAQTSDIWLAFARTFSMLFVVLALLILAFYLIKKVSGVRGAGSAQDHIRVLGVHHLSPKEKLVMIDVPGQTLLVGVTPASISRITTIDPGALEQAENSVRVPETRFSFASTLAKKLGRVSKNAADGQKPPSFKEPHHAPESGRK